MPNQRTDEKGAAFFETKDPKACYDSPAYIMSEYGEDAIKVTSGESYEVTIGE
jgi:hypothetical protein